MIEIKELPCDFILEELIPEETLLYYDGPLIFTCSDKFNNNYLAYWCDKDDNYDRWMILPLTDFLKNKELDLRTMLMKSTTWLLDTDNNGKSINCWSVKLINYLNYVPESGVYL